MSLSAVRPQRRTARAGPIVAIDFAALLLQTAPRAARRLGVVGRAIVATAIGQRRFDRVVRRLRGRSPGAFLGEVVRVLDLRIEVRGAERLPACAECIVVANHPCGGAEGIALLQLLLERYGRVVVPANRLLSHLGPLAPILAPVDVFGRRRGGARAPDELTPAATPLLLFPAGRTARERAGVMREFPWKRGFVRLARWSGRPVVPVCVVARPSAFFRAVAKLRRALGAGVNLEMFLLVREVLARRRSVTLICEPPIAPDAWSHDRTDRAHARGVQRLLERRYAQRR